MDDWAGYGGLGGTDGTVSSALTLSAKKPQCIVLLYAVLVAVLPTED